jgi:oxalate decarboxylase
MINTNRRAFLGALAVTTGGFAVTRAEAITGDGHAIGYDVAPAADHLRVIPRKPGDPVKFTFALDKGPIKATSGGWARDVTARALPIATDLAGAHLFMNPGGSREMHWHNSAEWAYVLAGHCQVTVVDPAGIVEVANYAPGDLWYFPKGHAHAVQTLGSEPCHAVLAFDDGLYAEHGTFGISDWMSRLDPALLQQLYGLSAEKIPAAETYINQGEIIALDGPQAQMARELEPARSHRYRLMAQTPWAQSLGGTMHVASAKEYPISTTMTGFVTRLKPGAMYQPHWHPHASEWHYVSKGRTRVTLFALDKRMAVAELVPGECAYIPKGCGHSVQNIGTEECEVVGALDSPSYQESTLWDWLANVPRHLLANNFGVAENVLVDFGKHRPVIVAAG